MGKWLMAVLALVFILGAQFSVWGQERHPSAIQAENIFRYDMNEILVKSRLDVVPREPFSRNQDVFHSPMTRSLSEKLSVQSAYNRDVSIRLWFGSNHYNYKNALEPNETNPGFSIEMKGGDGRFLPSRDWSFGINYITKNTTGWPASFACVGMKEPVASFGEFSFSVGVSPCAGLYGNKQRKTVLPFVGIFPTFSIEQGDVSSFSFTLLPKNPFNPIGKQAASITSGSTQIPNEVPNTHSQQGSFGLQPPQTTFLIQFRKVW